MTNEQSPDFGETQLPIEHLKDQAVKKTNLDLASLQLRDHLRITFDNETGPDCASSFESEFVVENFNASFAPQPPAPPTPYLRFINGNGFPTELQNGLLEFSGAPCGYSSIYMGYLVCGHSIEMRRGKETANTPPVSGFTVLRPGEDGSLCEIPPNALQRTVFSEEHAQAQILLEEIKASFRDLSIGEDQSDSQAFRNLPSTPHLDGETVIGTDLAIAHEGEYYLYDSQLETMYVVRQHSGHHIQTVEYRHLSFDRLRKLSDIAIPNLYSAGVETITYNTSNRQSIYRGGIAYAPNTEDTASKLHLKKTSPDSHYILYPPTFNIDARGTVQIDLENYLCEQGEDAKHLVDTNARIERADQQIKIQMGDKTIYLPTTFSADGLRATLSRMRRTLPRE